jgi:hypothetical protein
MRMRSVRRPAAVAVILLAAVFGAVGGRGGAHAASPSRQGWWKVGLPVADVGIGGLGNLQDPQGVDVPDGGLLVQGGASVDQPAAYAAVAFDLGTAAVGGALRLVPAPNAVSVPGSKLIACPLDDADFKPVDGGAVADGPKYSCSSAVNATVDSSGAYVFDIAGLRRGDSLGVAILPSAPTDRVVFNRPSDDALPVTEAPPGTDASGATSQPSGVGDLGPTDTLALPPSDVGGPVSVGSTAPPVGDTGVTSPASAPVAGVFPAAQPATATHAAGSSYVPWFVAGLVGLAAVLWVGAGGATSVAEETP